jgi:putative drug exporter of the RND superfamily
LIKAGWITVNTEGTFLLLVLVFGAGTDYSLLLVHRYREELQRGRPGPEALPLAVRESAPALASSAGTVIAAMLILLVAELESTHWLGPILAIGIAVMLLCAFTLLPALLSVLGERAFWTTAAATRRGGPSPRWQQIAGFVRRRSPALVLLVPLASSSSPSATSPITARSASARARPARRTRAAAPRSSTNTSRRGSVRR